MASTPDFGAARVGQRVRKKSKRYEDFFSEVSPSGGALPVPAAQSSPSSVPLTLSASTSAVGTPSTSFVSGTPMSPSMTPMSPMRSQLGAKAGGGSLRESGFTTWSHFFTKKLMFRRPDLSLHVLKEELTNAWNKMSEQDRAEWRSIAAKVRSLFARVFIYFTVPEPIINFSETVNFFTALIEEGYEQV